MESDFSFPLNHLRQLQPVSHTFASTSNYFTTLSSDGHLLSTWLKTGTHRVNAKINTKSSNSTTSVMYLDSMGDATMLTGGGIELPSSPSKNQPLNPFQGIVKQWDQQKGSIVATYMGGAGLVRCLGVPGCRMMGVSSILEPKLDTVDPTDLSEEQQLAIQMEADPYFDPTFNVQEEVKCEVLKKPKAAANRNKNKLSFFVAGGDDGTIRLWDCKTTTLMKSYGNNDAVKCLATCTSKDHLVVSGHRSPDVYFWDLRVQEHTNVLRNCQIGEVNRMCLSDDGVKLFTAGGSDDCSINEFDVRNMRKVKQVGFHDDKILSLNTLTIDEFQTIVISSSKDGTVKLTHCKKSGVQKSKSLGEIGDHTGWISDTFCVAEPAGVFAGGQKKRAKATLYTVGTDRSLRSYRLADVLEGVVKKPSEEKKVGGGSGGRDEHEHEHEHEDGAEDEDEDEDEEKREEEKGADRISNYHDEQAKFWESFDTTTTDEDLAHKKGFKKPKKHKNLGGQFNTDLRQKPTHDENGHEIGSLEYWGAIHEEKERVRLTRPTVGCCVCLVGDNVVLQSDGSYDENSFNNSNKVNRSNEAETSGKCLQFNSCDLGYIISDDKSQMPFEVRSGLTNQISWYENSDLELANEMTINRSAHAAVFDVDLLMHGGNMAAVDNEDGDGGGDSSAEEEEMSYEMMMMMGGRGHGDWDREKSEEKREKEESKKETEKEAYVRPPSPPKATPTAVDNRKATEAQIAEEERQKAVQDSLAIYRQNKKKKGKER